MTTNEDLQNNSMKFSHALAELVRLSEQSADLERQAGLWCSVQDLVGNENAARRAAGHVISEIGSLIGPKAKLLLAAELVLEAKSETDDWIRYCKRMNRTLAYLELISSNLRDYGVPNATWGSIPPEGRACECIECETGV